MEATAFRSALASLEPPCCQHLTNLLDHDIFSPDESLRTFLDRAQSVLPQTGRENNADIQKYYRRFVLDLHRMTAGTIKPYPPERHWSMRNQLIQSRLNALIGLHADKVEKAQSQQHSTVSTAPQQQEPTSLASISNIVDVHHDEHRDETFDDRTPNNTSPVPPMSILPMPSQTIGVDSSGSAATVAETPPQVQTTGVPPPTVSSAESEPTATRRSARTSKLTEKGRLYQQEYVKRVQLSDQALQADAVVCEFVSNAVHLQEEAHDDDSDASSPTLSVGAKEDIDIDLLKRVHDGPALPVSSDGLELVNVRSGARRKVEPRERDSRERTVAEHVGRQCLHHMQMQGEFTRRQQALIADAMKSLHDVLVEMYHPCPEAAPDYVVSQRPIREMVRLLGETNAIGLPVFHHALCPDVDCKEINSLPHDVSLDADTAASTVNAIQHPVISSASSLAAVPSTINAASETPQEPVATDQTPPTTQHHGRPKKSKKKTASNASSTSSDSGNGNNVPSLPLEVSTTAAQSQQVVPQGTTVGSPTTQQHNAVPIPTTDNATSTATTIPSTSASATAAVEPAIQPTSQSKPCCTSCGACLVKFGRNGAMTPLETFARTTIEDNINYFKQNRKFVELLEKFFTDADDPGEIKSGPQSGDRYVRDKQAPAKNGQQLPIIYVQLAMDWFNKHQTGHKSLGNICGRIMNLADGTIFDSSFLMHLAIFDNRREPSLMMNSLLKFLIREFLDLENRPIEINGKMYLVRLWNILADDPAARKILAHVGHRSRRGCMNCFFAATDFSYYGPDASEREPRTNQKAVNAMEEYKAAAAADASEAQLNRIARTTGCRCSILRQLTYIDLRLLVPFDILHGLHIGIVKRQILLTVEALDTETFTGLLGYLLSLPDKDCPPLGTKSSLFPKTLRANQLKHFFVSNWLEAICEVVADDDIVNVTKLLVNIVNKCDASSFTTGDIKELEQMIYDHHVLFAEIFGTKNVTVNFHKILHLGDDIREYGAPITFSTYMFEREQGSLAKLSTAVGAGPLLERKILYKQYSYPHSIDPKYDKCLHGDVKQWVQQQWVEHPTISPEQTLQDVEEQIRQLDEDRMQLSDQLYKLHEQAQAVKKKRDDIECKLRTLYCQQQILRKEHQEVQEEEGEQQQPKHNSPAAQVSMHRVTRSKPSGLTAALKSDARRKQCERQRKRRERKRLQKQTASAPSGTSTNSANTAAAANTSDTTTSADSAPSGTSTNSANTAAAANTSDTTTSADSAPTATSTNLATTSTATNTAGITTFTQAASKETADTAVPLAMTTANSATTAASNNTATITATSNNTVTITATTTSSAEPTVVPSTTGTSAQAIPTTTTAHSSSSTPVTPAMPPSSSAPSAGLPHTVASFSSTQLASIKPRTTPMSLSATPTTLSAPTVIQSATQTAKQRRLSSASKATTTPAGNAPSGQSYREFLQQQTQTTSTANARLAPRGTGNDRPPLPASGNVCQATVQADDSRKRKANTDDAEVGDGQPKRSCP